MLQLNVHKSQSVSQSKPASIDLTSFTSMAIANQLDVMAGEDSFWLPAPVAVPASGKLAVAYAVRADATRLTTQSLRDVVFSSAFSGDFAVESVFPLFFRYETTDVTADINSHSITFLRWYPPEYSIVPVSDGLFNLNFSDCTSFDAFPYNDGYSVYFGVAFFCIGLTVDSFNGYLNMRCNYSERVPLQPLKA